MKVLLEGFTSATAIRVRWGEMDAANHVNNVVYLRWSETARFEYFQNLGIPVIPENGAVGLILGWQDCKYIAPVVFPDTVHIGTRLDTFGKDRFTLESHFFSEKQQRLVAISHHQILCYDYQVKCKVDIPETLKNAILEAENAGG